MSGFLNNLYADSTIPLVKEQKQRTYLLYKFPEQKKLISKLTYEEKMEWYASISPESMVFLGNDKEFKQFWFWSVLLPVRIRRIYYRVKNFEIFKRYKHISEIRKK